MTWFSLRVEAPARRDEAMAALFAAGAQGVHEDGTALVKYIATLLNDRELCRRMGDAGRIEAEQAFGLDRLRSETFSVYRAEGWRDR